MNGMKQNFIELGAKINTCEIINSKNKTRLIVSLTLDKILALKMLNSICTD